VRLCEEGDTIVVVVDFPMREVLMQAEPGTFFITDHYLNYPSVLARLATLRSQRLREVLGHSWRFVAPASLQKASGEPGSQDPPGRKMRRK
jgi:hypothetical protein